MQTRPAECSGSGAAGCTMLPPRRSEAAPDSVLACVRRYAYNRAQLQRSKSQLVSSWSDQGSFTDHATSE